MEATFTRADVPRILEAGLRKFHEGELDDALELYDLMTKVAPDAVAGWVNKAVAEQAIDKKNGGAFAGKDALMQALSLRRLPQVMNDAANCLMYNEKRYSEAASLYWEAAVRHKSETAAFHLALCLLHLANETGDAETWRQAWDWNEWRPQRQKLQVPDLEYRGEDVAGKTIAVHFEQGLGDQIWLLRFVRELSERGAKVFTISDKNVRALLNQQPYIARTMDEAQPQEFETDFIVMGMSLPPYVQDGQPFQCDDYVETKVARSVNHRPRIGLCWSGSTATGYPGWRNVPADELAPLMGLPVEFVSLQFGAPNSLSIDHESIGKCKNLWDTTKLIRSLDAVVTCDTVTPHLAAAVGVPVILMDRWSSSWQWTPTGSRFYKNVTTIRQEKPGEWGPVIQCVSERIREI